MLGVLCDCLLGFYYLWAAFNFVNFLFQFFSYDVHTKKRGFPLFSLYFYCTVYRIVLFIVS
jgi:hypothetical protein